DRAHIPLPPPVSRSLWTASVERERVNRILADELARVARGLGDHGVACIPFKGPTLSVLAHGDVAVRELGDLDVLVRRRDMPAARRALEALGYRMEYEIPEHAERALLDAHKHYDIVLRGTAGNLVELHWRTDADFPVERDDDEWWATPAFSSSELMLVLLLHGSKHHWSSLQWLADVAALARREAIDWSGVLRRADELHCRRRVALGVRLMRDLLGVAVSEAACAAPARVAALATTLSREAFETQRELPAGIILARNFLLYDRLRDAMRNAIDAVFAPTFADWTRWRLPAALSFLYFPLRLARLCGKHAMAALRSLRPRSRIGATLRTPPPQPHSKG
ncbi:MAG TPA: nucleotidyltransferase family protein, partial [Usitatibacter sp.]|nr:nucleotidyltransferase family protein [Usitatibacter sp.]